LEKLSVVIPVYNSEKTIMATYYFTGGLLKNKKVYAEIKSKKAMLGFEIPAGYSIKESVIG